MRIKPENEQMEKEFSQEVEVKSEHHMEVSGLRPFTHYRIFVSASTIAGEGPTGKSFLVMTPETRWFWSFYCNFFNVFSSRNAF